MGPVREAAGVLFSEFNPPPGRARSAVLRRRLHFFQTQEIRGRSRSAYPFRAATRPRGEPCEGPLGRDPHDRDALLAMTMSAGLRSDFSALIEKRNLASLHYTKDATAWPTSSSRPIPPATTLTLPSGVSRYIIGSMSAPVRWILRFGGVQGDKQGGIAELQTTAEHGHLLAPFARILLAIAYVRDKDKARAKKHFLDYRRNFREILSSPKNSPGSTMSRAAEHPQGASNDRRLINYILSSRLATPRTPQLPFIRNSPICNSSLIFRPRTGVCIYLNILRRITSDSTHRAAVGGCCALPAAFCADITLNGAGATFPTRFIPEVVQRIQQNSSGHTDQLSVDWQRRRDSTGHQWHGRLRRQRRPHDRRAVKEAKFKIFHIPTVLGAVVPAYNVPGVDGELKFTPDALAEIFSARFKIGRSRDRETNPGVKFPNQSIIVVHRFDGSGTTYIFTDFLSKVSKDWESAVGKGSRRQMACRPGG